MHGVAITNVFGERIWVEPVSDRPLPAWDFAGGVCAAGESYDDCARREVAEKLGVVGAELRFLFRHRYRGAHGEVWGAVYEVKWDGPVRHQESEVAWSAWVAPPRLQQMLDELEFCPDSREVFERLGAGRMSPG